MRLINLGNVKNGGARKGFLLPSKGIEIVMEAPSCFLYTRNGFIPHMTPDLWEKLEYLPKTINTSLNYIVERDVERDSDGKGFSRFAQLSSDIPVFLSQTDHTWLYKIYGNDNKSSSVWAKGGRTVVTPNDFVRHVKSTHPQIVQILCDNETFRGCSRKRCTKAVERTIKFSDAVLEQLNELISSGDVLPFGSVTGGFDLRERQKCCEHMASLKLFKGFVIDGFCSKDECFVKLAGEENAEGNSSLSVMRECIRHLPNDLPRFMPAVGPPADVLVAVESGIDLFDGSFPCIASENGWSWTFDNSDNEVWIDFKKDEYQKNFGPIGIDCGCYTCRRHTRAYVTHLVNTRELLAKTLLNIHNSHQYFRFFNHLRESIANGEVEKLKERLNKAPCPNELYTSAEGVVLENSRFT